MFTVKNISGLLALLVTSVILSSCATGGVTSVDPCIEIPFQDAPEGACTNTVTHKAYLVNAQDWAKKRPHMIMIHADDWTKIKLDWLKGCRILIKDGARCNVAVDSVDKAVLQLDGIIKNVMGGK